MHCPGAAQPTVTFLGVVLERGGQLNSGPTLLHYRLQTTVYNSSARTYHTFPVTAYFKNGQRWANFPPLAANSYVFLTGRIFGLTKQHRQLAVVTDDIHFLPRPNHLPTTPSSTGKRKRVDRWSQRAGPQTPTKSAESSRTEPLPIPHAPLHSPEVVALDNEDEDITQIEWPETTDENEPSPPATTIPPERRSRRQRKTSYADIPDS
jgi:hypothetical protein